MKTIAEQIKDIQQYFIDKIKNGEVEIKYDPTSRYSIIIEVDGSELSYYQSTGCLYYLVDMQLPTEISKPFNAVVEQARIDQSREAKLKQYEQLQQELGIAS